MDWMKITVLCTFVFLVFAIGLGEAAWLLEGQVWNSPYQRGGVYFSQLSLKLEPHEYLDFTTSLPIQYRWGPELQDLQFLYPRLSLTWLPPLNEIYTGHLRADYHLKPQRLSLQGGLHMLYDPMALSLIASYQERTLALEGSVLFAINERWALGTHLHYANNSLLTYELYYTSPQGKQRQIRYSHYLDSSMQCLGFRISF